MQSSKSLKVVIVRRTLYMSRSQTSTEYLIILAVVIIIALIVVGVLGGIPGIGGEAGDNSANLEAATKSVGVRGFQFTDAGLYFEVVNNLINHVQIKNITWDGQLLGLKGAPYPFTLSLGESKRVASYLIDIDGTATMTITYEDLKTSSIHTITNTITHKARDNAALATGLVGYWNFDDNNGTHAIDVSSNENLGLLRDNATIADAKMGNALQLDGDGDYMNITDDDRYDLFNLSIVAWIKTNQISGTIFQNGYFELGPGFLCDSNFGEGYRLSISNSVLRFLVYREGSLDFISSTFNVSDNLWHQAVVVIENNFASIYVNGDLNASRSILSIEYSGSYESIPRIGVFRLEGSCASGFSNFFNGSIDEVMIWDRALSASEIRALYELGR